MSRLQLGAHYLKNGLYLAHASRASYEDDPESSTSYRRLGLSTPFVFKAGTVGDHDFGFAAHDDDNVVVAIRGSDDIKDWRNNLKFGKTSQLGARVHTGFWRSMRRLLAPAINAIKTQTPEGKKLWLTGHSRGGGIATLLAQQLYSDFAADAPHLVPKALFTFGAPRVGDFDFYRGYDLRSHPYKTVLFINESDPIPDLPPIGLDFYHVERQFLLREGDAPMRVDLDDPSIRVRLLRLIPDFGDHSGDAYIANISGALEG